MNFNLLNTKPDVSKTGKLAIALYPNSLIEKKNGKQSWYARVVNRSKLEMSDIADDMVTNGVAKSKEEILDLWRQINNAVISRLAEGLSVNTGICTIKLSVTGTFDSPMSNFNPEKNSIEMQFRPQSDVSEIFDSLEPVISQAVIKTPDVLNVTDTNGSDSLTPGGFLLISGKNLKIAGDDSSVGLYFENMDDQSDVIHLSQDKISYNTPTKLMFVAPSELQTGATYQLRIVSQFSNNNYIRKETVEGIYTGLKVV